MIEVKKLNETITSLENEVDNIRKISGTVEKMDKLSKEIMLNQELYKEAISTLVSSKNDLANAINKYEQIISEIKPVLKGIEKAVDKKIQEIHNENTSFNKELYSSYKDIEEEMLTRLQDMRSENKKNYLEFEDILTSKLERNKSDILVEIRDVNKQIEHSIDQKIVTRIEELDDKIMNYNIETSEKMEKLKVLLIVSAVFSLLSIIFRFI